jgi:murein L,D-transpeptidase YcbB/YkuD
MDMPPLYDKGREYMEREDRPEHPRLVNSLKVPSRVPIFITYYTIYPDPEGQLQYYADVYGYDAAMGKVLKHYTD